MYFFMGVLQCCDRMVPWVSLADTLAQDYFKTCNNMVESDPWCTQERKIKVIYMHPDKIWEVVRHNASSTVFSEWYHSENTVRDAILALLCRSTTFEQVILAKKLKNYTSNERSRKLSAPLTLIHILTTWPPLTNRDPECSWTA